MYIPVRRSHAAIRAAASREAGIDPQIPIPKLPQVKLPTQPHVCCPPGSLCPTDIPPCGGAYCTEGTYCPPGTPIAYSDVKKPTDFHLPLEKLFPIPAGVCCPSSFPWCSQLNMTVCPAEQLMGNLKIMKIALVDAQGTETIVYDAKAQMKAIPMWKAPQEVVAIVSIVNQSQTVFDVSVRVFGDDVGTGTAHVLGKDVVDVKTTPFHVWHTFGAQIRSSSTGGTTPSWFGLSADVAEDELSIDAPSNILPPTTEHPAQPSQPTTPAPVPPTPPAQDGLYGIPWWMVLALLVVIGIVLFVVLNKRGSSSNGSPAPAVTFERKSVNEPQDD